MKNLKIEDWPSKIISLISLGISLYAVYLGAAINHNFNKEEYYISTDHESTKEVMLDIIEDVYSYRTPFTIDYEALEEVSYTNYQCADPLWDVDMGNKIRGMGSSLHNNCEVVDMYAKMRNDFQRKTIKARILGSEKVQQALDEVEKGFDDVLIYYLSHDYYMRALPDAYLKIMPERMDKLIAVIREEITVSSE